MSKKWKIGVLVYLAFLVILTLGWYIFMTNSIKKDYIQTTAIVTDLKTSNPGPSSYGDTSSVFPLFEYEDRAGQVRTYQSTDGFNRYTKTLFGVTKGEHVIIHYNKDTNKYPNDVMAEYGFDWYLARFAPAILGVFSVFVILLWAIILSPNVRARVKAIFT